MKLQSSLDAVRMRWNPEAGLSVAGGGALHLENSTASTLTADLDLAQLSLKRGQALDVRLTGETSTAGGAALVVRCGQRTLYPIPLNSRSRILLPDDVTRLSLRLAGRTNLEVAELSLTVAAPDWDLLEAEDAGEGGTLLLTPTYPSSNHLYLSGFTHARVLAYRRQGVAPLVVCAHSAYEFQTVYEFEGVRVLRGSLDDLARLLSRRRFEKILVHFFDPQFAHALDRALLNRDTPLVFWCHGPETLFRYLPQVSGPYFTTAVPPPEPEALEEWRIREHYLRKYERMDRVTWVFVSEWMRRASEEQTGIRFRNARVIPNLVDPDVFRYRPKDPELRKRVFFLRRYDDERKYAIDLAVRAVLHLSKRPCFEELRFDFYGDGGAFDALVAPLRRFGNVSLHRRFLDHQEISRAHERCGIALFPSRVDAQGVSALEAASSGLAVVSSDCTAIPEFIPRELGTLAPTEDAAAYARIVEELVLDPERFSRVSEQLSARVRAQCSPEQTIGQEISLIREPPASPPSRSHSDQKLLTVVVPVFNMESRLERCVASLLAPASIDDLEVLIIDDGSQDGSLALARQLEAKSPGVVRVIAKPNGGHGSVINRGIAEARGTYLRIVDSDDWVDSLGFGESLERLRGENADLVLTDYAEVKEGKDLPAQKRLYENLTPGILYDFDTLADRNYGFKGWGPVLATATIRTERLRQGKVQVDEGLPYVDMEYDTFVLPHLDSVRYQDLDVYRYEQGRDGQTVSEESYRRNYKKHEQVILRICDFVAGRQDLSEAKRRYVLENVVAELVEGHRRVLRHYVRDAQESKRFEELVQSHPLLRETLARSAPAPREPMLPGLAGAALEAVSPALPYFYVESLKNGSLDSNASLLRHTLKFLLPHALVEPYLKREKR